MTPLRRKMIEEFQIRHYAHETQKSYLHCVARFAQHFGQSVGTKGRAASKCGTGRTAGATQQQKCVIEIFRARRGFGRDGVG
jgi:hypothetical protein